MPALAGVGLVGWNPVNPPGQPPRPRAPRPPVSRQRYMARRAGALVVLLVIVVGAALVLRSIVAGDDDGRAGDDSTSTTSTDPSRSSERGPVSIKQDRAETEPSESTDSTDDPAATGDPGDTDDDHDAGSGTSGVPTADEPAVVYIAGDSDAGTFGPYLQELLDETGIVDTTLDYKVSSGLARPDFYDWPERFRSQIPKVDPEIVVVTFGGNDSQGLAEESGDFIVGDPTSDTKDWKVEYGKRVSEVMDYLADGGRTLIWVGIPNDDNPDVTARLRVQDQAVRAAAAEHDGVVYIDTWNRFSGRDGNFAEYVIDPRDGEGKDVRTSDGFHLNETGAEILALDIADAVYDALRERGADL